MELTKFTQDIFDLMPIIDGRKQCPTGDYSKIENFPSRCIFKDNCKFGVCSNFGERCHFGEKCIFEGYCDFGSYSAFGSYCRFGKSCDFGIRCNFGLCCVCEFGEFTDMILCSGFRDDWGVTYFFRLTNGDIFVRYENFGGSINEWEFEVKETHEGERLESTYLSLIPVIKAQFE